MQQSFHIGNYTLLYKIGCGSFASVYMGMNDLIGHPVAIKQIRRENYSSEKEKIMLLREISIMKMAMHQYIAELFEIIDIEDEPYIYLVQELVSNGSIKSLLLPGQPLSEDLARKIFSQLIVAVGYLHFNLNIIHRDLKAENILLDQNQNIRLIDFGLSTAISIPAADMQRTTCGSPAYTAPEIILQDSYTESADIWSLGILLYLMTTGHFPFDTNSVTKLLNDIVSTPVDIPTNISLELQNLLSKILDKNPKTRISLISIMKHPWFTNYGYFNILHPNFSSARSQSQTISSTSNKYHHYSHILATKSTENIKQLEKLRNISNIESEDELYKMYFDSLINEDSIDIQIIDTLRRKGVDISNLESSLMNHELNEVTACYRILYRFKIAEDFNVSYSDEIGSFDPLTHCHHHHHDKRIFSMHQISSCRPANKKATVKTDRHSPSHTIEAANFIVSQCSAMPRKNASTKRKKANSDPMVQSNVPTKLAPRQSFNRKRLISGIPKSFGRPENQSLASIQDKTNESINDAATQRHPTQQQLIRQNQQQHRQTMMLKEQHQQQQ